jgi:hypothetical protein
VNARRTRSGAFGVSQDVALDFQLPVFAPEPAQFLALLGRERAGPFAAIGLGLEDPVPDGLLGRLELGRQLFRGAARACQGNDLLTLGRRVGDRTTGHR